MEEPLQLRDGDVTSAPDPRAKVVTGDFDTFYRREISSLVVLARALAGPAVAEDVAQETMLAVYRRWAEVSGFASPVGWARSVCLHKAVSVARRRSRERRVLQSLGAFRAAPVNLGEDEQFWAAVRSLPTRQAQSCALHYGLDLPVADVAVALGCAEGTVKSHLSRARAALAQSWNVGAEETS